MNRMMKLQQARARAHESGFTLVELAIVLVIIGLIIGGVLVGQDLIKAAEIRATTADLERYNASANTFRNKYNGLPGDLRQSRAEQFGMVDRAGTSGSGDGNGVIEGCAAGATALGCETALFWVDLTSAQLIGDAFNTATDAAVTASTIEAIEDFLPAAPLRETAFVSVFPQGGRNYYSIMAFTEIAASGAQTVATDGAQALSPLEASQVDDKIDDGAPLTGIVRAIADMAPTAETVVASPDADTCITENSDGDDIYYVSVDDHAANLNCAISIRSSF